MSSNAERIKMVGEATQSVRRLQEFAPESVAREGDLGKELNFRDAVPDVRRLVELYRQIPLDALVHFSHSRANQLKQQADADFNRLQELMRFSSDRQHPKNERNSLMSQLQACYEQAFEVCYHSIAYASTRAVDYVKLGSDARATVQQVEDLGKKMKSDMEKRSAEADQSLEAIRKVAAEQGVSQQAIYFKSESDVHAEQAKVWLGRTTWLAVSTALLALASFWVHNVPGLTPDSAYVAVQLAVSKALFFAVAGYFLLLAARNYMAHRHNAVVNKHRQNALVTFRALVEAAGQQANKDIVLTKAAECIFGAQATGFSKADGSDSGGALSILSVGAAKQAAS